MKNVFKIGTRKSPLALKQVNEVVLFFKQRHPEILFEIKGIDTLGDKDKKTSLHNCEGTDFFTREIENALIENKIDLAVHSAKDLPDPIPKELEIAALSNSIDNDDVLVSKDDIKFFDLPLNAKIGTSSVRRKEAILKQRPDIQIKEIRGNIEERIGLLKTHDLDAVVIAAAAMKRLGLENLISDRLLFMETHPLQGCLAIQIKKGNPTLKKIMNEFDGYEYR